jgi:UDP-N-acetylmuramate dehydrogenase
MSRHTSWRVGGPARYFFIPAGREDLARFLQSLETDTPILWVGLGSNLLVRDGGFDGAVIATHRGLSKIERYSEREVLVQAGVPCARLARFSNRPGLCGVEFMAGIPGTVGGALAMNAGAFGGETWQSVTQVELV